MYALTHMQTQKNTDRLSVLNMDVWFVCMCVSQCLYQQWVISRCTMWQTTAWEPAGGMQKGLLGTWSFTLHWAVRLQMKERWGCKLSLWVCLSVFELMLSPCRHDDTFPKIVALLLHSFHGICRRRITFIMFEFPWLHFDLCFSSLYAALNVLPLFLGYS